MRFKNRVFAVYKGDSFIFMGHPEECANELGVSVNTINFYTKPVYKRRIENNRNATRLVDVTEVGEDER